MFPTRVPAYACHSSTLLEAGQASSSSELRKPPAKNMHVRTHTALVDEHRPYVPASAIRSVWVGGSASDTSLARSRACGRRYHAQQAGRSVQCSALVKHQPACTLGTWTCRDSQCRAIADRGYLRLVSRSIGRSFVNGEEKSCMETDRKQQPPHVLHLAAFRSREIETRQFNSTSAHGLIF
jgi:hypothetical protein